MRGTELQVKCARDLIEDILDTENTMNLNFRSGTGDNVGLGGGNSPSHIEEPMTSLDTHWMSMNSGYRGNAAGNLGESIINQ